MRLVTITFEVTEDYLMWQLHEDLCLAIHENDPEAQIRLEDHIVNVGQPEKESYTD